MAFIIDTEESSFFYPVKIPVVGANGVPRKDTLEVKFRRLTRSEIKSLQSDPQPDSDPLDNDIDFILSVAEDWKVSDKAGAAIPFDRENLRTLLDRRPAAAGAIVETFFEAAVNGGAKRKN